MSRSGVQSQAAINCIGINARKCHYHILSNRNHFYLNHALILVLEKQAGRIYRLVVYHDGQFLKDLVYYSLRGAKIAFIKYFKNRAYSKNVEAEWSETEGNLNELSPPLPQLTSLMLFQSSEVVVSIDIDSLISEIKSCMVNVVGRIALEIEVNEDIQKTSFWDELETEFQGILSEKFKIDMDLTKLKPLTLEKIADYIKQEKPNYLNRSRSDVKEEHEENEIHDFQLFKMVLN